MTAKTVENQLGSAYRKLGVSSRDRLREVLQEAEERVRGLGHLE